MATVADALSVLESLAPQELAFPWDKVGLQVGSPNQPLTLGVVALDRSLAAVEFAQACGAQLLVAHHPLIWEPLARIDPATHVGRTVAELIRSEIAFAAAHTNWDTARGGINDALASRLNLVDTSPFGSGHATGSLKLAFFCPESSVSRVVDALAAAGAGTIGLYRRCAFASPGTGTFEPLQGASPSVGQVGARESVPETRVEMRVPRSAAEAVRRSLADAHPYEEPAADWYPLEPEIQLAAGRIGRLPNPMPLGALCGFVDDRLATRSTAWGPSDRPIERVAVVGGAADEEWRAAHALGADALVTGEVRQHVALEASESGMAILAAGHYATENPGCAALRDRLAERLPEVEWRHFEPRDGAAGRPLSPHR